MKFRNEYWFLSNMFPCSIKINGYTFKCAESAFQSMKCTNEADIIVLTKMNGFEAKKYGRNVELYSDWNNKRIDAMLYVLQCKFTQHPHLFNKLIAIHEDIIEENDWNDTFWGMCNGIGENNLGKLLTKIKGE